MPRFTIRKPVSVISAVALTLALASCAPEVDANDGVQPSTTTPTGTTDTPAPEPSQSPSVQPSPSLPNKENPLPKEPTDHEGREPVETEKQTNFPPSFPITEFPVPELATVLDTGERSLTSWFVMYEFRTLEQANAALTEMLEAAGAKVIQAETDEDGTLTVSAESDHYRIEAFSYAESALRSMLSVEIEYPGAD